MTWLYSPSDPPARHLAGSREALLAIKVDVSQATATVVVTGELDLTTRSVLAERLALVLQTRPRRLILDMAGTRFMDCGSARLITSAGQLLPSGRLTIRHPSSAVRRVLELTGFGAECEIEDDLRSDDDCHTAGCESRPDRARAAALRRDAGR
jgi:anti-anti-sigma factor